MGRASLSVSSGSSPGWTHSASRPGSRRSGLQPTSGLKASLCLRDPRPTKDGGVSFPARRLSLQAEPLSVVHTDSLLAGSRKIKGKKVSTCSGTATNEEKIRNSPKFVQLLKRTTICLEPRHFTHTSPFHPWNSPVGWDFLVTVAANKLLHLYSTSGLQVLSNYLICILVSFWCGRQGRNPFSAWSPLAIPYTPSPPHTACHLSPRSADFLSEMLLKTPSAPACLYCTHLAQAFVSCHPACLLYASHQVKDNVAQLSSTASFQFSPKAWTRAMFFDPAILLGELFLRDVSKTCHTKFPHKTFHKKCIPVLLQINPRMEKGLNIHRTTAKRLYFLRARWCNIMKHILGRKYTF